MTKMYATYRRQKTDLDAALRAAQVDVDARRAQMKHQRQADYSGSKPALKMADLAARQKRYKPDPFRGSIKLGKQMGNSDPGDPPATASDQIEYRRHRLQRDKPRKPASRISLRDQMKREAVS